MKIAPSILTCDFTNLGREIESIIDNSDYIHIDVMDGIFVPNISIGLPVLKSLFENYNASYDTHLMIVNPLKYIKEFAKYSEFITFHLESDNDPKKVIEAIKKENVQAGISLRPKTKVEELIPYLDLVDMVLVMSVEPGFGGQKFDPSAIEKVNWLKKYREEHNLNYLIEVDGGINAETAKLVSNADILVAGSYIFNNKEKEDRIKAIKSLK